MAALVMLDPTGRVERAGDALSPRPEGLDGKRAAFIFNGHGFGVAQFGRLKELFEARYRFADVLYRVKTNRWAPSPRQLTDEVAQFADFAIVGVCA